MSMCLSGLYVSFCKYQRTTWENCPSLFRLFGDRLSSPMSVRLAATLASVQTLVSASHLLVVDAGITDTSATASSF